MVENSKMMTHLIRRVSKLLDAERKVKLLTYIGELEVLRAKKEYTNKSEEKVINRTEEEHSFFITALLLNIIEERKEHKIITPVDTVFGLDGEPRVAKEYRKTTVGIISVFEKATFYGMPKDAMSYWLNKKGRRKAFGNFVGWIYGEIPATTPTLQPWMVRPCFEFTVDEPHIEARKALRRSLKQKKVKRDYYNKHLKGNTLLDFAKGRAERNIKKKKRPYEEGMQEKLERRKRRDARKAREKESGS